MATLAEHISSNLWANFEIETPPEIIQEYIDSFEVPKKTVKKAVPAKTQDKKAVAVKTVKSSAKSSAKSAAAKTCEKLINTKNGEPRICGKNSTNEVDGHWFCGTEKSGCYKSALAKAPAKAVAKKVTPAAQAKGALVAKTKAKVGTLAQKVLKNDSINLKEIKKGSGMWVDLRNHRMVYTKDPQETFGVLDDDDETVLPLTEDAICFAEAHGVAIGEPPAPKKAAKKVPAKKVTVKPVPVTAKKAVTKVAAKKAPVAKKGKKAPVDQDDEILEDLQNEVDAAGAEEEPVLSEGEDDGVVIEDAAEAEDIEIDLGDDDAAGAEEDLEVEEDAGADEENTTPDVEEVEEGEAADDADDVEEDEGGSEE